MSTELRAGPVSYLVLGIVAVRGPSTSYDLKRFVQLSVGHFWPFPHTQLYAEPARLAEAGLLEETREESGRRRRHYAITDGGPRAARPSGSPSPSRPRWSTATSGCSSSSSPSSPSPSRCIALAHEQAEAQRRQLAELRGDPRSASPAGRSWRTACARRPRHPHGPRRRRVLGGRG